MTEIARPVGPVQDAASWGALSSLHLCWATDHMMASHICAYTCFASQFVPGAANTTECWLSRRPGGAEGSNCTTWPLATPYPGMGPARGAPAPAPEPTMAPAQAPVQAPSEALPGAPAPAPDVGSPPLPSLASPLPAFLPAPAEAPAGRVPGQAVPSPTPASPTGSGGRGIAAHPALLLLALAGGVALVLAL